MLLKHLSTLDVQFRTIEYSGQELFKNDSAYI